MIRKTRNELASMIRDSHGKILTVTFKKRTNNELRTMNCRTDVRKHLTGGGPKFDPVAKKLVNVYDMQAAGYRCIPEEGIVCATIGGIDYLAK